MKSKHLAMAVVTVVAFPVVLFMWAHSLIDPFGFWITYGYQNHHRNRRVDFFTFLVDLAEPPTT